MDGKVQHVEGGTSHRCQTYDGRTGLTQKHLVSEEKVASQRRMTRTVGLEARRKLERYCESFDNHTCSG